MLLKKIESAMLEHAGKVVIRDQETALTGQELITKAKSIGTGIYNKLGTCRKPVVLFMEKTPLLAAAMVGTAYSGCFYVVFDVTQPVDRVKRIFDSLQPALVIAEEKYLEKIQEVQAAAAGEETGEAAAQVCTIDELLSFQVNHEVLKQIADRKVETDILYVLYTSGSTGTPKGVVISYKAVEAYAKWVIDTFSVNADTIWGSQTPFYFSMSITDLYSTLLTGATLEIIPSMLFSFPAKLLDHLEERKVNSIYWVPSAYGILVRWKAFGYKVPTDLKMCLFAGETMPVHYLTYWQEYLPEADYCNLFGPTETTDICTWYKVDRTFDPEGSIPIGRSCENCDSFIVDDNGQQLQITDTKSTGELYVRGPFLAHGYYNNPEQTAKAFVQNPLQNSYPETVYKTGDLVKYNEYGEIEYLGRKDFQIKHMGYRIELGEIEAVINAVEKVNIAFCIYDVPTDRIITFYEGKVKENELAELLGEKLVNYMRPQKVIRIRQIMYNANGKIDRKKYTSMIKEFEDTL